ncbi:MAG: hypothetical protein JW940_05290 [Polyangiaceae bacterium]|nr:hypothetical protein [Polyangiaceae bacterium]
MRGWPASVGLLTLLACTAPPRSQARGGPKSRPELVVPRTEPVVRAQPPVATSSGAPSSGGDPCLGLARPSCTLREDYAGSIDHFVPFECSTLFELVREVSLTGVPYPLAHAVVLMGPLERSQRAFEPWLTLNYASDPTRAERLVLKPSPVHLFGIVPDPRRPVLLGRAPCTSRPCRRVGLWVLGCAGSCSQEQYAAFDDATDLGQVPELGSEQKVQLARAVQAEADRERRLSCMRSSAGCHDQPLVEGSAEPSQRAEAGWPLPGGTVRLELELGARGTFLMRQAAGGAEIDRWLLLSNERAHYLNAPQLTEPSRVAGGYLSLLVWDSPGVYGALVRTDPEGKLVGAPVRIATLERGIWAGGCAGDVCLIAISDGRSIVGRVLRLPESTARPCEAQEAVEIPPTRAASSAVQGGPDPREVDPRD